MKKKYGVLFILLFFVHVAYSYTDTVSGMQIRADQVSYNKKSNTAVYTGNVEVKEERYLIKANCLFIKFLDSKRITTITALGKPSYLELTHKDKIISSANKIVYYRSANKIVLLDKAQIKKNNNIITGNKIIYCITTNTLKIYKSSQERTQVILTALKPKI